MRNGMYAAYKGKEYQAARVDAELYKLIADDTEPAAGFVRSEFAPAYIKTVHRQDLDQIYIVKTYADFQGARLEVAEENGATVTLATSDATIAEKFGMGRIDRHDYRLKVNKSEVVRFIEEKRPV